MDVVFVCLWADFDGDYGLAQYLSGGRVSVKQVTIFATYPMIGGSGDCSSAIVK